MGNFSSNNKSEFWDKDLSPKYKVDWESDISGKYYAISASESVSGSISGKV